MTFLSKALYIALLSALLLAPSVEAVGNKKPAAAGPQAELNKTAEQHKTKETCAKQQQDCDTRARTDRSRADTASRDHHSEGHHDHGSEVQN